MRNFRGALGLAILLATALPAAQSGQAVPAADNERTGAWFVELSSPPTADGTSPAALDREEAAFHNLAAASGVRYAKGRSFRELWNGVTIRASDENASKVRGLAGVRSVYPVVNVTLDQAETPGPPSTDLTTAVKMTGADVAQSVLGLTGAGVIVAVIDSGIDYDHPDLGGCFGPGCRVEKGYDFVGDDYNNDSASPAYNPVPTPDPLPDDCNGHGTHVSGIVGANGGITGVAPQVTFHGYRVFGCDGPTSADIMLAAMEQAWRDGADVVNMSIGSALTWPQYPTSQAADRLVKRGITVVASIGNEGALGLYAASAPGNGKDVIGVASIDNTHSNLSAFSISPDDRLVGYNEAAGAPPPPLSGSAPVSRTGTTTTPDDACNALAPGSLTGTIALIRRGTCSFLIKATNAQSAGAIGVVLYNNVAGRVSPTVAGGSIVIPVVSITAADGAVMDARIAAGPLTLTWTAQIFSEPQTTGGLISGFSSYGLSPDLSLKPDLGAPGGSVRSTLPLEQGSYGGLSGTSMASPHVAGAVALLLEAMPKTKPDEVMARLRNTASPRLWSGNPTLGFLEHVHRQGAGMIQVPDAIEAEAVVTPSKLALGEIEAGNSVLHRIQIRTDAAHGNRGRGGQKGKPGVTYTLSHDPALSTGPNTFVVQALLTPATVTFSTPTVTLGGSSHFNVVTVDVTITPFAADTSRLFGGYIVLTPDDGSAVLRVPYAGYNGDYQAIQALTPTPAGFPWLAKLVGTSFVNQPGGATYSLVGTDVPTFLVHFDHQVQELRLDIVDAVTNAPLGLAGIEELLPRNSAPTSFFAITWDGTSIKKAGGKPRDLPNGTYRIELTALKALGDPHNPNHLERWTSPDITIARP